FACQGKARKRRTTREFGLSLYDCMLRSRSAVGRRMCLWACVLEPTTNANSSLSPRSVRMYILGIRRLNLALSGMLSVAVNYAYFLRRRI
ncbi:hypothetical protein TSAR_005085, partial [Trichomalopsis sarcophagae]